MTWSIIVTVANREKRLASALTEAGYAAFLPLKRTWRHQFGRHRSDSRPVMPGYVFAVIPPHVIHAFHSDGACRFLPVPESAQADVDTGVLSWQISDRYFEFDDVMPGTKAAKTTGGKGKPTPRNRRTRKIKKLMKTIADLSQPETSLAA